MNVVAVIVVVVYVVVVEEELTYLVLSFDKFDDVGGVVGEGSGGAALDVLLQQVVDVELLLGHGEDDVDGVLLDLRIMAEKNWLYDNRKTRYSGLKVEKLLENML
jgi:hypothetical protein